jgi:hypothetical protein
MRLVLGVIVFTASLVLGTFTASLLRRVDEVPPVTPAPVLNEAQPAPNLKGVKIVYAGLGRGEDGPYLEFLVYNGLDHRVTYAAVDQFTPVQISINGIVDRTWECQNGVGHFTIEPGRSTLLRVSHWEFKTRPRKSDRIAVELGLWKTPDGETERFLSETFHLPDEFRRSIGDKNLLTRVRIDPWLDGVVWKELIPFSLTSPGAAFVGARIPVDPE